MIKRLNKKCIFLFNPTTKMEVANNFLVTSIIVLTPKSWTD